MRGDAADAGEQSPVHQRVGVRHLQVQLIAKVGGNLFRALALHYPTVLVEHFCHGGADGVPILHLVFALEGDGTRISERPF